MTVCRQCGVELEDDMKVCPLCKAQVLSDSRREHFHITKIETGPIVPKKQLLQRILWQVTSVLLLSAIVSTLIIDLSIHHAVTWSIYPVSICLMIFSYALLIALWSTRFIYQLLTGWLIATVILILVSMFIPWASWPLQLALPILCALNTTGILLVVVLNNIKTRGLNVLAVIFVAIAVVCLIIDGVISVYFVDTIKLQWSIIVAACLLPVTAALLFMYFKTKSDKEFQKIFHT